MRDESLDTLLQMTAEIERFEFEAMYQEVGDASGQTPLSLVRELPARRSDNPVLRRIIAAAASIAACAALAFVAARGFNSVSPAPTPGGAGSLAKMDDKGGLDELIAAMIAKYRDPYEIRPVAHDASGERSERPMMLAVFKDGDAPCGCVLWKPVDFGGRPLTEVSRAELVAAAYKAGQHDHCASGSPLTFVMGLQGPRDSLPTGHDAAEALASCVAQSQPACGDDSACYSGDALRCLPEGVSVVAESLPR
ncbi:MAG: hypothetical protein WC718_10300 [Phycisphaerales bacterium]|jgi:hypothetical protein